MAGRHRLKAKGQWRADRLAYGDRLHDRTRRFAPRSRFGGRLWRHCVSEAASRMDAASAGSSHKRLLAPMCDLCPCGVRPAIGLGCAPAPQMRRTVGLPRHRDSRSQQPGGCAPFASRPICYPPGAYDLAPLDCRILDLGLPRALGAHTRVHPRRRNSPLLSAQRGWAASMTRSGGYPPNTGE